MRLRGEVARSSSNHGVAWVFDGLVVAASKGTSTITATGKDGGFIFLRETEIMTISSGSVLHNQSKCAYYSHETEI